YAGFDPFSRKFLLRRDAETDLAAGANQNDLWFAARRVAQYVCALRDTRCGRKFRAVECRHGLARKNERTRTVALLQSELPGFDNFVGIAGAKHQNVRHRTKRRKLLDRLVRRAVFTEADGVMREH